MSAAAENTPQPYAQNAAALMRAGWWPLPLPARAKKSPPTGYTGKTARDPNEAQVTLWAMEQPGGNIAVRMRPGCIGIDVDAYGDKPGAATLASLHAEHDSPPQTWKITSRDDPHSGIYLFRLPEGIDPEQLRGGLPGIETIRPHHRYVVAPGSIHPDTGAVYRAINEADGVISMTLPPIEDLPVLPMPWVEAFSRAERAERHAGPTASFGGEMCPAVEKQLSRALIDLSSGAARHDAGTREALALARLGEQGHCGAERALAMLGADFTARVAPDRPGGRREAEHEWRSICDSAAERVASKPTSEADKGCCGDGTQRGRPEDIFGPLDAPSFQSTQGLASGQPQDSHASPADQPTDEPPLSDWLPVDLGPYLDGTYVTPEPSVLQRKDGHGLFYAGLVHSIFGESESGKSWIALIACAEQMRHGDGATYIDFESDAASVLGRLRVLGITDAQIVAHFTYIRPQRRPRGDDPAWQALRYTRSRVVVIDGVTEALVTFGAATIDNDEISAFMRVFPALIAHESNSAVILIDHQSKSKDDRGRFPLGAQAKLASITGAAYVCEPLSALAPGMKGYVSLRLAKDRPGSVRAQAGSWRQSDRTQLAAIVVLDGTSGDQIAVSVAGPDEEQSLGIERKAEAGPWRPTGLMEKISRHLEANGDCTGYQLKQDIGGKHSARDQALICLADEGYISQMTGPRNSKIYHLNAAYIEANDVLGVDLPPPAPDLPPPAPGGRSTRASDDLQPHLPPIGPLGPRGEGAGQSPVDGERGKDQKAPPAPCIGCGEKLDPILVERGSHYGCETE